MKFSKITILAICLCIIAITLWLFLKPKQNVSQFITADVIKENIENSVLASGVLEATKNISVGAQVSGQVKRMYVALGDEVKQGQLIAQIDSIRQENDLKTVEATLEDQMAQLAVKNATLMKLEAEYKRQKAMFDQDATSKAELESALTNYRIGQAEIISTNAQIKQSKLKLSTTKEDLSYTRILAPIDGTVVAIVTEEGQTVNANQMAPTIVKLAKLDTMTVKAQISEADVISVRKGQSVYFTILGSNKKYYAALRQIEPAPESINADGSVSLSSNKTAVYYNALFDVPNDDGLLRIDMTTQVSIILNNATNTLTIPSSALIDLTSADDSHETLKLNAQEKLLIQQQLASLASVRILQPDGFVVKKYVLVGINNNLKAQVLRGLNLSDKVIIADNALLNNSKAES